MRVSQSKIYGRDFETVRAATAVSVATVEDEELLPLTNVVYLARQSVTNVT